MNVQPTDEEPQGQPPFSTFDEAHPIVYGYLLRRCGSVELAEDLTAATFVTALADRRRSAWPVPWLLVVARNKLIDHWRRQHRSDEIRRQQNVPVDPDRSQDEVAEAAVTKTDIAAALARLSLDHRSAIVLHYLDDLPVAAVADEIGRSVRATESLLVRARTALRDAYGNESSGGLQ